MYCVDIQGAVNDTKSSSSSSVSSQLSASTGVSVGAKIIVSGPPMTLSLPASIANSPALKGTRKQRYDGRHSLIFIEFITVH